MNDYLLYHSLNTSVKHSEKFIDVDRYFEWFFANKMTYVHVQHVLTRGSRLILFLQGFLLL